MFQSGLNDNFKLFTQFIDSNVNPKLNYVIRSVYILTEASFYSLTLRYKKEPKTNHNSSLSLLVNVQRLSQQRNTKYLYQHKSVSYLEACCKDWHLVPAAAAVVVVAAAAVALWVGSFYLEQPAEGFPVAAAHDPESCRPESEL